ncbi:hypothetical protein GCM10009634_32700 [Saccharothrix xinjiangensis]
MRGGVRRVVAARMKSVGWSRSTWWRFLGWEWLVSGVVRVGGGVIIAVRVPVRCAGTPDGHRVLRVLR